MIPQRMCLVLFAIIFSFSLPAIPTTTLDSRTAADLRLIAGGFLSPLDTFMSEADYNSVLSDSRLADGTLFPLPFILPVDKKIAEDALREGKLLLQDETNMPLALCNVTEMYEPNLEQECMSALGTLDPNHPFVPVILARKGKWYVSGALTGLPGLAALNRQEGVLTAPEVKNELQGMPQRNVIAFQTRNPIHQAHFATIQRALSLVEGESTLFLHPAIGPTQDEDVPPHVRKKCYEATLPYFSPTPTVLCYLPIAMRMAGPREALLHAIIRKNCGATHFIVGKDQASPSSKQSSGEPFYPPHAACELAKEVESELGLKILAIPQAFLYVEEWGRFVADDELPTGAATKGISGTLLRKKLKKNESIPAWFSFPEVMEILSHYYQNRGGLCIYLTGLSGCGKTTIARALKEELQRRDPNSREVVLIDGDTMRRHLTPDLGFSKEDRSKNVRRIGFVASLITASGGSVICANIAPYEADRAQNRKVIGNQGTYIEVFVDTPLEVCEERDAKGLYKQARAGLLPDFIGISSPYETPVAPELRVDGTRPVNEIVAQIMDLIF